MKNNWLSRISVVIYWVILLTLLCLFFTNDFGLVDIRKTSIITAVGIDYENGEVQVSAQLAVPKPSQSGENIQYTAVQGSGLTAADALNEINAKTGFYPKLVFCKLIVLGESCKNQDIFEILNSMYRHNFSELTAQIAMFDGKASDVVSMPTSLTDENELSISRVLTEELKKSANVSSVDLKTIAVSRFSKSGACYMPFVEATAVGTSEKSGKDTVGGEKPEGGQGGSDGGSESSGGGSGGGSEGSGGSEGGQSSSGGQGGKIQYIVGRTAVFADGKFCGTLDQRQAFALNLLENDIALAVTTFNCSGKVYTVGLKNASGGISIKADGGTPVLTLSFKAKAQIQAVAEPVDPKEDASDDFQSGDILKCAEDEIKGRMESLVEQLKTFNADALGAKEKLYRTSYNYYQAFKDDLLDRMKVEYEIKIESVN